MAEGLAPQPTLADLMEQLQLLASPRQGLGMSQQALPQPPAPDIWAALLQALGVLGQGPGQALFGDPLAGEDPETRRLIEMSVGAGSPMGLVGIGRGMAAFGPERLLALRNVARQAAGKQTISPQLPFAERQQIKSLVETLLSPPYMNRPLTGGQYERIMATIGILPPTQQRQLLGRLGEAEGRLGTPSWSPTPVVQALDDLAKGVIPHATLDFPIDQPSMSVAVKHLLRALGGGQ